jgi:hypothetical protein
MNMGHRQPTQRDRSGIDAAASTLLKPKLDKLN